MDLTTRSKKGGKAMTFKSPPAIINSERSKNGGKTKANEKHGKTPVKQTGPGIK